MPEILLRGLDQETSIADSPGPGERPFRASRRSGHPGAVRGKLTIGPRLHGGAVAGMEGRSAARR